MWALVIMSLTYITTIVWVFYQASRPVISYEEIDDTFPLSPVCAGQNYEFVVKARAHRTPAVVVVTENWVSQVDARRSILDNAPEWRIIPEPVDGLFIIQSNVPRQIRAGTYTYLRALGLNKPYIVSFDLQVRPEEECRGTPR